MADLPPSYLLFLCNIANVAQRTFEIVQKLRSREHNYIIILTRTYVDCVRVCPEMSYHEAVGTLHCTLENVSDLNVIERQKTGNYCARSTEEEKECQMAIFYFALRARKLRYYGDVIRSFDWKSAVEQDVGV